MNHKNVILLGPPASGKGTQAKKLAAHLGVPCLGTGQLLRAEIEKGSAVGMEAKGFIDAGPESKVIALDVPREDLEQRIIKRRECTSCGATVAVDDLEQTICPECGADSLVSRADDALESFKVRYENYEELTIPLYAFLKDHG